MQRSKYGGTARSVCRALHVFHVAGVPQQLHGHLDLHGHALDRKAQLVSGFASAEPAEVGQLDDRTLFVGQLAQGAVHVLTIAMERLKGDDGCVRSRN